MIPPTPPPHPANAPGPFYVGEGCCFGCLAAEGAAPGLMSQYDPEDPGDYHCHLLRQPTTPAEIDEALRAACVNCPGGVRYGGTDPEILGRLERAGFKDRCDAHVAP